MISGKFILYLLCMAGVTYLVRMVPLVLCKKKIKNRFLLSFLYYVPIAVLSAMTVPAIFFATDHLLSAAVGFVVAVVFALFDKSLFKVAAFSCIAVFITELLLKLL